MCYITLGKTERPVRLGRSGPWRSDPRHKINCEVKERCRCGVKKPEGEVKKMNESDAVRTVRLGFSDFCFCSFAEA
jgi:hypothetical protein